jgi:hypothetical protein
MAMRNKEFLARGNPFPEIGAFEVIIRIPLMVSHLDLLYMEEKPAR